MTDEKLQEIINSKSKGDSVYIFNFDVVKDIQVDGHDLVLKTEGAYDPIGLARTIKAIVERRLEDDIREYFRNGSLTELNNAKNAYDRFCILTQDIKVNDD